MSLSDASQRSDFSPGDASTDTQTNSLPLNNDIYAVTSPVGAVWRLSRWPISKGVRRVRPGNGPGECHRDWYIINGHTM